MLTLGRRPGGLIGAGGPHGRRRQAPPTPYGTRDPKKIVAMGEVQQQTPQAPAQGFDYDQAFQSLQGDQTQVKPWQYALAALGDGISNHYGNGGGSTVQMLNQRQLGQQQRLNDAAAQLADWQYRDWTRQNEADLRASNPFTIGRDRLQYDPQSGQVNTLYDGQEDFELYARELGLEPGSPEYFQAVEDHVLRSSGPSAHQRDLEADDYRTANDERLEDLRYSNRRGLEAMRQGNRLQIRNTPPARSGGSRRSHGGDIPTFRSPAEARNSGLPSGTPFMTPDGRRLVMP